MCMLGIDYPTMFFIRLKQVVAVYQFVDSEIKKFHMDEKDVVLI